MNKDVILVEVVGTAISKMVVKDVSSINYEPGRSLQILKSLNDLDNSITMKGLKYPLIAMVMPVIENRGRGYYATVKIPRIVIATIVPEPTDSVLVRYNEGGTFKTILYPCYYEFLKRLAWSPNIAEQDPDAFIHAKMDNPGTQPVGSGSTDFIDSIEILNLEFTLIQLKNC